MVDGRVLVLARDLQARFGAYAWDEIPGDAPEWERREFWCAHARELCEVLS